MSELLPIFPLGQVLMPGRPLPLRIFEPRYRAMLADLAEPKRFGVVLLSRGLEVNTRWAVAPDPEAAGTIAAVGTVAEVMELRPKPDGSWDVLAVGSRRFRISTWVRGKPYGQADVEFLSEQDGDVPAGAAEEVAGLFTEYGRLMGERTGRPQPSLARLPPLQDANLFSYYVAASLPLDERARQALLTEPDAGSRLSHQRRLLRREVTLLTRTGTVPVPYSALRLDFRPN